MPTPELQPGYMFFQAGEELIPCAADVPNSLAEKEEIKENEVRQTERKPEWNKISRFYLPTGLFGLSDYPARKRTPQSKGIQPT